MLLIACDHHAQCRTLLGGEADLVGICAPMAIAPFAYNSLLGGMQLPHVALHPLDFVGGEIF